MVPAFKEQAAGDDIVELLGCHGAPDVAEAAADMLEHALKCLGRCRGQGRREELVDAGESLQELSILSDEGAHRAGRGAKVFHRVERQCELTGECENGWREATAQAHGVSHALAKLDVAHRALRRQQSEVDVVRARTLGVVSGEVVSGIARFELELCRSRRKSQTQGSRGVLLEPQEFDGLAADLRRTSLGRTRRFRRDLPRRLLGRRREMRALTVRSCP